jgi:glutamate-1-semialdehyde 2,1-aminomutase
MAAGLANLALISRDGFFEDLTAQTAALLEGLREAAAAAGVPVRTTQAGGMFGLFFTDAERVVNFEQAGSCDVEAFRVFYHHMLDRGVYLAPSAFEAGFVSSAHGDEHIEATVAAARESFERL